MMQSGELERLYNKWFMSPIPPKGINLNLPMSDLLKELIRNPNDEGN
jgi:glutamate/aspartate transport system substrate-binding protein